MKAFNNLIGCLCLIEVSLTDQHFTWSSMRVDPSLAKLDRVLVSRDWKSRFCFSFYEFVLRPTLDHISICLHLENNRFRGRRKYSSLKSSDKSIVSTGFDHA